MEVPTCVSCICNSCGNFWKSEIWEGKCPNCGSDNIDQNATIDLSKLVLVVEKS